MSTEVQPTDTSAEAAAAMTPTKTVEATMPAAASTETRPALWQRRRFQAAAVAAVVLVIAGVVANNFISGQYTAAGAVNAYLTALSSGDASGAWSQIEVVAPTNKATAVMTDQGALQAALANAQPDFSSFDITGTSSVDSRTDLVAVTLATSKGSQQAKFVVQRSGDKRFGFYPVWRVMLQPTLLQISLPTGSAGITLDGSQVALPPGKSTLGVLPIPHKLQVNGTQILAAQTIAVDGFLSSGQTISYQPTLTPAGTDKAKAAIKAFIEGICAKSTSTTPDRSTCPQVTGTDIPYSGQWTVIGDPTQDLTIKSDQDQNVVGVGHFQMVFAYNESGIQGTQHAPSSGGYSASLGLSATDVTVTSVQPLDGLAGLSRPAGATDQAAKDLVAKAFASCAAVSAGSVADCPQAAPDIIISDVHWTLQGDPMADAIVSFDTSNGVFTVHGNFAMGVTYNWLGSHPKTGTSYITAYLAYLFWDGQLLQLVTIDGAPS